MKNPVLLTDIYCYEMRDYAGTPQLITNAGYCNRLRRALEEAGLQVEVSQSAPVRDVYTPSWESLRDVDFRYKQRETLEAVLSHERGRIHWATGTGKTWLLPLICLALPKCKIVVTTKHLAVLETIYARLAARVPSVGLLSSRRKKLGRRVTCVSSGSLHHALQLDPDVLLADEVQELATDVMFEKFAAFRNCRMYSLSANDGDRFDKADFELEAFFGEVISSLSYAEAEANGMVVPIHVYWRNVFSDKDPGSGLEGVPFMRHAVWRNKFRNAQIAADAREFVDDQVLITCRTLEHAAHLKKLLPEYQLCYSPMETYGEKLDYYKRIGLLPTNERRLTVERLRWMRERFEQGKMRKVIATSVWNRGVSFDHLQVLLRTEASSSAIDDTQIPGRLSRMMAGKSCGVLIDYLDQFNQQLHNKAKKRQADYRKKRWQQFMPEVDEQESLMRIIQRQRLRKR